MHLRVPWQTILAEKVRRRSSSANCNFSKGPRSGGRRRFLEVNDSFPDRRIVIDSRHVNLPEDDSIIPQGGLFRKHEATPADLHRAGQEKS